MRAAAALGPKTRKPNRRSASARPEHERHLGPDDDEIDVERAREPEQPFGVVGANRMALGERGDPRVSRAPRGARSAVGDCASFQASACSRPPEPTTRTRTRAVYDGRRDASRRAGDALERGRRRARTRAPAQPSASTCSRAAPSRRASRARRAPPRRTRRTRAPAPGARPRSAAPHPRSISNTGRQWWKSLWCAGKSSVSEPSGSR